MLLSIYQLRCIDISMREHVLFLYLVEGGDRLRAHDGTIFNYYNGDRPAFETSCALAC